MGLDVTKAGRLLLEGVGRRVGYESPQVGEISPVQTYSFMSQFSFPGFEKMGVLPPSQFSDR